MERLYPFFLQILRVRYAGGSVLGGVRIPSTDWPVLSHTMHRNNV